MYKKTFYAISLCIVGTLGTLAHTTDLHKAARNDDPARMQDLINAGHDVNAQDTLGETPLHDAVFMGNTQAVSFLIENGAETPVNFLCEYMKKSPFITKSQAQEVANLLYATQQINNGETQTVIHSNADEDKKARFIKIALGQNRYKEANYLMQHTQLSTNNQFGDIQIHAVRKYSRAPHQELQNFINSMHKHL